MKDIITRNSDQFQGPVAPTYGRCLKCGDKLAYRILQVSQQLQAPYMDCRHCNIEIESEIAREAHISANKANGINLSY